ncbi:hypothetical protein CTAYLR_006428 [Chrysophaeum taylorii]|uniref:Methionine aminopeptidase n=1 Tax=Chrysophaeum taylorii TaxID=2483200 RepID=A0AAD7U9M1_9STRA|nr:hypothetical protein CTAYLR_006428 [Chrysophaeum taylorii]
MAACSVPAVLALVIIGRSLAFDGGQGFGASKTTKKKAPKRSKAVPLPESRRFVRPIEGRRVRGVVGPRRRVPPSIARPDYAETGVPGGMEMIRPKWLIEKKSDADVSKMRVVGRIAREVLDVAGRAVAPGVTTDELDAVAHAATVERGAYPSPLNYCGYPKSICTSVNEIICHGIPDDVELREGDVVNIDVTVFYDGFHGDCSEMFYVGPVDDATENLVRVTYDAWQAAIDFCAPGKPYKEIGGVIEDFIKPHGYASVRQFCGHGIGRVFHTTPDVLHYRNNEPNGIMAPGHVFTIEPMICEGTYEADMWDDDWTAATSDLGRSAQFEHTLLLTETGAEPLTAKLPTSPVQPWER